MTQEEIIDGNRLIAGFMGAKYWPKTNSILSKYRDAYEFSDGAYSAAGLAYHDSWNWLMPALDKIEAEGCSIRIESNLDLLAAPEHFCSIWDRPDNAPVAECSHFDKRIDSVYCAVIDFIKWRKSQLKP